MDKKLRKHKRKIGSEKTHGGIGRRWLRTEVSSAGGEITGRSGQEGSREVIRRRVDLCVCVSACAFVRGLMLGNVCACLGMCGRA